MGVAGVSWGNTPTNPNAAYWKDGVYATRQQHEEQARIKAQQAEREAAQRNTANIYSQGAPSGQAANTAASNVQDKRLNMSVDPTGRVSLSNDAILREQAAAAEASRRARERAELLALIEKNTPGASAATITHPGTSQASQDARTAAFSRAKDQAGQIARASLTAIAEEMAGRGISGSGIEALREAGTMDQAAGGLVEVTRDQALADAARQASIDDQSYQGQITQRAQDLANRQSYLALLRSIYNY